MSSSLRLSIAALSILAGSAAAETIAITGVTAHTMGPAGTVENATIIIRDGLFEAVGNRVQIPEDATTIDGVGKIVTPGLFSAFGQLGLTEVSGVEESVDYFQTGDEFSAAFDISDAYNHRSTLIPINRAGGVTRALTAPAPGFDHESNSGNIFSGLAAVVQLGETPAYIAHGKAAMIVNFGQGGGALAGGSRAAAMLAFRSALENALDYRRNKDAYERGQRRDYAMSMADLGGAATCIGWPNATDRQCPIVLPISRRSWP